MSILSPDAYFSSVTTIDFAMLRGRGIRGLIIDLDNTLLAHNVIEVTAAVLEWATAVRAQGFEVCLVSNNWGGKRVARAAESLGFQVVGRALKPLPFPFRRAMRMMGTSARETAVIGDQVFTDVLGGNLAGAFTILVQPIDQVDLPHTWFLRMIERRLLRDRQPSG